MVCYTIPIIAAILHYIGRKKIKLWKNDRHHSWLALLLVGGSIFGLVDHFWNGELFLIGENAVMDIMLGVTITIAILVAWTGIVVADKVKVKETAKTTN